jgi:hypothetical protein
LRKPVQQEGNCWCAHSDNLVVRGMLKIKACFPYVMLTPCIGQRAELFGFGEKHLGSAINEGAEFLAGLARQVVNQSRLVVRSHNFIVPRENRLQCAHGKKDAHEAGPGQIPPSNLSGRTRAQGVEREAASRGMAVGRQAQEAKRQEGLKCIQAFASSI